MSAGRREERRGGRTEEGGRDSGGEGGRGEERANVGRAWFLRSSVIVRGVKGEGKESLLSIIPRYLPTCGGKAVFFWLAAGRQGVFFLGRNSQLSQPAASGWCLHGCRVLTAAQWDYK